MEKAEQPAAGDGSAASAAPAEGEQASAAARIVELRADEDWMQSYAAGDRAKVEEFTRLHSTAYGNPQDVEARANAELFPEPSAPTDYRFSLVDTANPTDEARELDLRVKTALYEERVSPIAVSLAQQIIDRNGILDDAVLSEGRRSGLSELERRHGKEGAATLLKQAGAIFERIAARSEDAAYLVDASGAGNDPHFIETLVRVHRARKGG